MHKFTNDKNLSRNSEGTTNVSKQYLPYKIIAAHLVKPCYYNNCVPDISLLELPAPD